jgi:four helix bundle protein
MKIVGRKSRGPGLRGLGLGAMTAQRSRDKLVIPSSISCYGWREGPQFRRMADFRKLEVWRRAHELMLKVHLLAGELRGGAYLSLRSQIIRAAMSIPANIVEGRAQRTDRDFSRFLGYAIASASELEYHLLAARDLGLNC